jgi:hypothetical protein
MSHTPGPWNALPEEDDKPYIRIRGTRIGCRHKIANVMAPNYGLYEAEETRANARLIAAAPELIRALKALLDSTLAPFPNAESGKDAQDAWADMRAEARNNARNLIAEIEASK